MQFTFKMAICLQPFHTMSIRSFACSKLGEDEAEAENAVAVARSAVVTVRQATVPRIVVPATTSVHAVCPTLRLPPVQRQATPAKIPAYSMLGKRKQRKNVFSVLFLIPFSFI